MRVLCLAAHPDDETLGVGGTLVRHARAGDAVTLVVATVAFEPRWSADVIARKREECRSAARILGVHDVRFLEYRTMHLNTLPAIELSDAVGRAVADVRPDVVYAPPCDDLNRDHATLFEAAQVATRPTGGPTPARFYSYEIPTTTRFNLSSRWWANSYRDISTELETKLAAMSAYATELRDPPHPRSIEAIRAFARERGAAIGCMYAEALMLVRELG